MLTAFLQLLVISAITRIRGVILVAFDLNLAQNNPTQNKRAWVGDFWIISFASGLGITLQADGPNPNTNWNDSSHILIHAYPIFSTCFMYTYVVPKRIKVVPFICVKNSFKLNDQDETFTSTNLVLGPHVWCMDTSKWVLYLIKTRIRLTDTCMTLVDMYRTHGSQILRT